MTPPRLRGLLVLLPGLFALAALGWLALARPEAEATRARQVSTPTPWMGSPYYGHKVITSYFDHEYPTFWRTPNGDPNQPCTSGDRWNDILYLQGGLIPTPLRIDANVTPAAICGRDCVRNEFWPGVYDPDDGSCDNTYAYDGHDGIDYGLSYEPVLATAEGVVGHAGWQNPDNHRQGYGLYVRIDHPNGHSTYYGHLSAVIVGQAGGPTAIDRGDQVGTSGTTGNSTGPHLHFEVRRNGIRVDPYGWNGGAGTDPWENWSQGAPSYPLWAYGDPVGAPFPTPLWDTEYVVDDDYLTPVPNDGFTWGCTPPPPLATPECPYWWNGLNTSNLTPGPTAVEGEVMFTCAEPTDWEVHWARWHHNLPEGFYEIQVFIPADFANAAPRYMIHHYDYEHSVWIDTTVLLDQARIYQRVGQWVSIGSYYFRGPPNDLGYVQVTSVTGEAWQCVFSSDPPITPGPANSLLIGVDAVRFRHLATAPLPPTETPPPSATPTPTETPWPSPTPPPLTPQVYLPVAAREYVAMLSAASSYYVSDLSSSTMYDQGCAAGATGRGDAFVLLDFGPPWADGTTSGTWLYNDTYVSTAQIAVAAEEFLRGYWNCAVDSPQSTLLTLGLGTSNRGVYATAEHGAAWGALVRDVAAWVDANSYRARVAVAGAWDVEPTAHSAAVTRAWSAAYGAAAEGAALYNVGDAAGCTPDGNCPPGWTPADLYDLSWGAAWAYAVPRIYTRDGAQARQWVALSRFGQAAYGARIHFSGALTQQEACRQIGCLPATDNAPAEGWQQLWAEASRDLHTRLTHLPWSADLRWDIP